MWLFRKWLQMSCWVSVSEIIFTFRAIYRFTWSAYFSVALYVFLFFTCNWTQTMFRFPQSQKSPLCWFRFLTHTLLTSPANVSFSNWPLKFCHRLISRLRNTRPLGAGPERSRNVWISWNLERPVLLLMRTINKREQDSWCLANLSAAAAGRIFFIRDVNRNWLLSAPTRLGVRLPVTNLCWCFMSCEFEKFPLKTGNLENSSKSHLWYWYGYKLQNYN